MLELGVEYENEDRASVYRPAYNPAFKKRALEKQKERARENADLKASDRERTEDEVKALQETVSTLSDEVARLRVLLQEVTISASSAGGSPSIADLCSSEKPSVRDIIRVVSRKHRVSVAEILGQRRSRHIVAARFEAIALAHKLRPELSLPQLGKQFGDRDHTSILSALRRVGVKKHGSAA